MGQESEFAYLTLKAGQVAKRPKRRRSRRQKAGKWGLFFMLFGIGI